MATHSQCLSNVFLCLCLPHSRLVCLDSPPFFCCTFILPTTNASPPSNITAPTVSALPPLFVSLSCHAIELTCHVISRKRALGGRYCLVCSLVARSATSGGGGSSGGGDSSSDSNVMALSVDGSGTGTGTGGSLAGNQQRRQPLGYLGPGTGPRTVAKTDSNVQQQFGKAKGAKGAAGTATTGGGGVAEHQDGRPELHLLASPVAISRLRRGSGGSYCCGTAAQRLKGLQGPRGGAQQQRMAGAEAGAGAASKDGKFVRPLPRTFTRRGSWGGELGILPIRQDTRIDAEG